MKRLWIGAVLLSMLFAAPAFAQFGDDEGGSGTTTTTGSTDTSSDNNSGASHIPGALTMAMVGGVAFPSDILTFNYFAFKVFLPNQIQVEPFLLLALTTGYDETDDGTTDTRDENSSTSVGAGVLARYPLWTKHNVQFHVIGSGSITFIRGVTDPDGPDNSITTTATVLGLGYGAGVEWYILSHVSVFAQATNPIAAWTNSGSTTAQPGGADDIVTKSSNFAVGIVWDPSVLAGFTLFY